MILGSDSQGQVSKVCSSCLPAFDIANFLIIEDIFIIANRDVFFTCKKMHTLSYRKHLHSYEVALINNFVAINYDELLD